MCVPIPKGRGAGTQESSAAWWVPVFLSWSFWNVLAFPLIAAEARTLHFSKDERVRDSGSCPPLTLRIVTPLKFSF